MTRLSKEQQWPVPGAGLWETLTFRPRRRRRLHVRRRPHHVRRVLLTLPLLVGGAVVAGVAFGAGQPTPSADVISTLIGTGTPGAITEGTVASDAALDAPSGVVATSAGVYVADSAEPEVTFDPAASGTDYGKPMVAGDTYVIAGTGSTGAPSSGALATGTTLGGSGLAIAVDGVGDVFVADTGNSQVDVIPANSCSAACPYGVSSMSANHLYVLAGTGAAGYSGDGATAAGAQLAGPEAVAVDAAKDVYIADTGNNVIRFVAAANGSYWGQTLSAGWITTVVGGGPVCGGATDSIGNGCPATQATLSSPAGVATDGAGDVFVADTGDHEVRVLSYSGGSVLGQSTFAGDIYDVVGNGVTGDTGDSGLAINAEIAAPMGLVVDPSGDVYVSDTTSDVVRFVPSSSNSYYGTSMAGNHIYAIAGNGTPGFGGDGGVGTSAGLDSPIGVATDTAGELYIADSADNRIRLIAADVAAAPSITSPATANFVVGAYSSFPVTTSGLPVAAVTESGTLPTGLTYTGSGDGAGTISGTAAPGTAGSYSVTLSATSTAGAPAQQGLTIDVEQAPQITSSSSATFTAGTSGSFRVTASGSPSPTMSILSGSLPSGLSLASNGTISGTPAAGTGGVYRVTIEATNGAAPNAIQSFVLTVDQAPAVSGQTSSTMTVGTQSSYQIPSTGYPSPAFTEQGALPGGINLTSAGSLTGTPASGTAGTYPLTISASNGTGAPATESFVLTVNLAPAITSPSTLTCMSGSKCTFTVQSSGSPTSLFSESGALPSGLTFTDNRDGSATISGTPGATAGGTYPLAITASNGVGAAAVQNFVLYDTEPLAISRLGSPSLSVGQRQLITISASGFPTPNVAVAGQLPPGMELNSVGGIATISGTPTKNAGGVWPLVVTASTVEPGQSSATSASTDLDLAVSSKTSTDVTAPTGSAVTVSGVDGSAAAGTAVKVTISTKSGQSKHATVKVSPNHTYTWTGTPSSSGPTKVTFTSDGATLLIVNVKSSSEKPPTPLPVYGTGSSGTPSSTTTETTVPTAPGRHTAPASTTTTFPAPSGPAGPNGTIPKTTKGPAHAPAHGSSFIAAIRRFFSSPAHDAAAGGGAAVVATGSALSWRGFIRRRRKSLVVVSSKD